MRHLPSSFCGLNSSRASGWSSRIKLSMLRNATTKRNDEKLETSFFFCKAARGGVQNVDVMFALAIAHTSSSSSSSIHPSPSPSPSRSLRRAIARSFSSFFSFFLFSAGAQALVIFILSCSLSSLYSPLLYSALLYYTFASSKFSLSLSSSTSTFIPPIHDGSGPIHCAWHKFLFGQQQQEEDFVRSDRLTGDERISVLPAIARETDKSALH